MAERVGLYSTLTRGLGCRSRRFLLLTVKWFILLGLEHTNIMCLCHLVLEPRIAIGTGKVAR